MLVGSFLPLFVLAVPHPFKPHALHPHSVPNASSVGRHANATVSKKGVGVHSGPAANASLLDYTAQRAEYPYGSMAEQILNASLTYETLHTTPPHEVVSLNGTSIGVNMTDASLGFPFALLLPP